MNWYFNPNQLSTWEQAKQLALDIQAFREEQGVPFGGGVLPVNTNPETSGIYVPTWSGGPGGFPEPNDAEHEKYWLHFRFVNGQSGVNVGLILDKLERYGGNKQYVFMYFSNSLQ